MIAIALEEEYVWHIVMEVIPYLISTYQPICIGPPTMAPSEIMRRIKGRTATKLFEEFPMIKKRYWDRHF